jgi:hypothetical protein
MAHAYVKMEPHSTIDGKTSTPLAAIVPPLGIVMHPIARHQRVAIILLRPTAQEQLILVGNGIASLVNVVLCRGDN